MQVVEKKRLNGVDGERLLATIEAVKQKPALARFNFRARSKWLGGAHMRTTIKDFYGAGEEDSSRKEPFVLHGDEPTVLLGEDQGANAVETALHALACCAGTSFVYHASAQGVKIDAMEVELEGDIDIRGFLGLSQQVRNGFEGIRMTFRVKSEAPKGKLEELCTLARRRSPVHDLFSNPTPVAVRLKIV